MLAFARKNLFYECLAKTAGCDRFVISVRDLAVCIGKQQKGKTVGLDNIAIEAFMYGGLKMSVHLCFLFNMFINVRHLPRALIQSVIIPLGKCKSGNLSDVNNYTVIAISTAMSKILENVNAESAFLSLK